jgi:hypothetical protein
MYHRITPEIITLAQYFPAVETTLERFDDIEEDGMIQY